MPSPEGPIIIPARICEAIIGNLKKYFKILPIAKDHNKMNATKQQNFAINVACNPKLGKRPMGIVGIALLACMIPLYKINQPAAVNLNTTFTSYPSNNKLWISEKLKIGYNIQFCSLF